jgi:hypothetical protein
VLVAGSASTWGLNEYAIDHVEVVADATHVERRRLLPTSNSGGYPSFDSVTSRTDAP